LKTTSGYNKTPKKSSFSTSDACHNIISSVKQPRFHHDADGAPILLSSIKTKIPMIRGEKTVCSTGQ
jgi:hypothetical protein